jgi:capsular polysaccharide biosynthesis protein
MTISVTNTDYDLAIEIANAVAEAFVIEMRSITGSDAIQVLDQASVARLKEDGVHELWKLRALFFIAGMALACAYFFVKEFFSDKIRSLRQVEIYEDKILGIIPLLEEGGKGARKE